MSGTTDLPLVTGESPAVMPDNVFDSMIQKISVKTNLGREALTELGRRGPYHRYVSFPVEAAQVDAPTAPATGLIVSAATGCY